MGGFTPEQGTLLKTFADQAVIAIENVRLFTELEKRNRDLTEALDRQTATAEVLRVISQSQTELQPVFEAIAEHAMRLFRAWAASVLRSDGQLVHLVATRGGLPGSEQQLREQSPWSIQTSSPVGECLASRTVVQISDIESDPALDEGIRNLGRTRGWRSILAAPIVRDGQPIGAIAIQRAEAGHFSPAEIELLKTFADQAVIAIENTRLLGELRARTEDLTRSVGQLTALGEISHALSSTLDVDGVLNTVVTRANDLIGADGCTIFEYDEVGEQFHLRATRNLEPRLVELARGLGAREVGTIAALWRFPVGSTAWAPGGGWLAGGSLAERYYVHQHSPVVCTGVTNPARGPPPKSLSPRMAATALAAVAKVKLCDASASRCSFPRPAAAEQGC